MPFVRHELGRSLRIKRIPDLHVHLDDTAERGTRVLQLLNELGAGAAPEGDLPLGETLPTPVAARPPRGRRARRAAVRGDPAQAARPPPDGPQARWHARLQGGLEAATGKAPMSIDLGPYLDAVPDAVVERLRSARRVLAVGHENPDADTLGATLGVVRIVETLGGAADPVCTDPVPPLYDFLAGVERVRTDPDPAAPYDLLVVSDCGSLDRIGDVRGRHAELFERLPRVVIDHHASNDAAGETDWIEPNAAATCEMVALLATRHGRAAGHRGWGHGGCPDGRDRHGHRHVRAPERDAPNPGRVRGAGRGRRAAVRHLPPAVPLQAGGASCGCSGGCSIGSTAVDGGRVIYSTLLDADLAATGTLPPQSEGIIDLLAQADEAEVAILFKEAGEATRISVRTKPGGVDATVLTGKFGGGGHARAAGATVELPVDQARPAVLAEADRLAAEVAR